MRPFHPFHPLHFVSVIVLHFVHVAMAASVAYAAQAAGPSSLQQITEALNAGQYNQAIRAYTKIGERGDCSGYRNRAIIFKDLGQYDLAIKTLLVACSADKGDIQTLRLLGRLYFLDGQIDNAIRVLRSAADKAPDIETIVTLGLCYQARGDAAAAQDYLAAAVILDADNVLARLSLAGLYYRQKRLAESAAEYKKLSVLDASIQQVFRSWADAVYTLGNDTEAYRLYDKVQRFDPKGTLVQKRLDELRARLGTAYFEKERQKRAAAKERKAVFVKPVERVPGMHLVRIGLHTSRQPVELKCSTDLVIRTKANGIVVGRGAAGSSYRLMSDAEGKLIITDKNKQHWVVDETVLIQPAKPFGSITVFEVPFGKNEFWENIEDRSYRGSIEISAADEKLSVINVVSLEEYLYGVVPAEMPASWPLEALKAQAVAARSETMAKLGRHRKEGFDLCPNVHCQVYAGVERETEATNLAVDQTRGMILEYDGKPVDAVYSSNCGGHTQENVFSRRDVPYFKGTPDMPQAQSFPLSPAQLEQWLKNPSQGVYCNIPAYTSASNFRWVRVYSAQELRAMVAAVKDIGDVRSIRVLKRNPSGHIAALKISGDKDACVLEQELKIRTALGNLRSSMFKVEVRYAADGKPEQFVFYGGGWGHGVGMCQAGACGMAKAGKDYTQILEHYYSSTQLKKLY